MSTGLIIAIIIGAVALLVIIFIWSSYNSLVRLNERVNEAWSDIEAQLKRRADLIPNLAETVKGYTKHESETIKAVSDARAKMMGARSVPEVAEADQSFMGALSRIMAVSESYPELKADKNFQQLQEELSDTEDKVLAARRFYNNGAKELNTKIQTFPINLFKGFGFKPREYFKVADRAKVEDAPEVKF